MSSRVRKRIPLNLHSNTERVRGGTTSMYEATTRYMTTLLQLTNSKKGEYILILQDLPTERLLKESNMV